MHRTAKSQTVDRQRFPAYSTAIKGLVGLMIACFFSFLDRQILNLLVQPIKHDLAISDTQIGVLQGIAFAVSYSIMALPFGWLADRFNRARLVCFGLTIWSFATLGMAFSENFGQMVAARILIGAGEAALMPAAYSMLADYFPPLQRGRAYAVFMSAVFLGNGGALLAGGFLLGTLPDAALVRLPVLGEVAVWRAAFIGVSLPGLLLVWPLLSMIEEPTRQVHAPAKGTSSTAAGMIAYVARHRMAFFMILGTHSLFALIGYATQSWAPTLLIRNHDLGPSVAGLYAGLALLMPGIIAVPIGGILGDRWVAAGRRGGRLPLIYYYWIASVPSLLLFFLAANMRWALAGFLVFSLLTSITFVSTSAVLQDMVPAHLRGQATALWYLVTGTLGNGLGPVVIGAMNDHLFHSEDALHYSLLAVTIPSLLLGLVLTIAGAAAYDRARAACAAQDTQTT